MTSVLIPPVRDENTRILARASLEVVPPDPSWPPALPAFAGQVLTLVNAHRATLSLSQLAAISTLTASSEWKSRHEAFYGYPLNHDDPAPPIARTWYQRLLDNGYPGGLCAENIAQGYPSAQAVLDGWLASPGHKENLEDTYWTVTGIGVAASPTNGLIWTQSFGVGTPDPAPTPPPVGPTNTQLVATALAHFRASTLLLSKWDTHVYKTAAARAATENGKALAALAQIKDSA